MILLLTCFLRKRNLTYKCYPHFVRGSLKRPYQAHCKGLHVVLFLFDFGFKQHVFIWNLMPRCEIIGTPQARESLLHNWLKFQRFRTRKAQFRTIAICAEKTIKRIVTELITEGNKQFSRKQHNRACFRSYKIRASIFGHLKQSIAKNYHVL